jgi:hypothetical protein
VSSRKRDFKSPGTMGLAIFKLKYKSLLSSSSDVGLMAKFLTPDNDISIKKCNAQSV